jgi:hypothetical protein
VLLLSDREGRPALLALFARLQPRIQSDSF